MKRAFVTELSFVGRVPIDHDNLRTEFTWMILADAVHHNIYQYDTVTGYDEVYVIIPKGTFNLNVVGAKLSDSPNPISKLLSQPFIKTLRRNNTRVYVVQEGPVWMHSDWSVTDQMNWYTNVLSADAVLCHNKVDRSYWVGLLGDGFPVLVLPTMMLDGVEFDTRTIEIGGALVGGNLSRWYGGFQSLTVASEWGDEIWIPDSHSRRDDEGMIEGVHHLPRLSWKEWMNEIRRFKVAVHLMPTAAAGSFYLNTGFWGIPTLGNTLMDTAHTIFPDLSVYPEDLNSARLIIRRLKNDPGFYHYCSDYALETVGDFIYTREDGMTFFDELSLRIQHHDTE